SQIRSLRFLRLLGWRRAPILSAERRGPAHTGRRRNALAFLGRRATEATGRGSGARAKAGRGGRKAIVRARTVVPRALRLGSAHDNGAAFEREVGEFFDRFLGGG